MRLSGKKIQGMRHFRNARGAAYPFPAQPGAPIRIHKPAESPPHRGQSVEVFTCHINEPASGESSGIHPVVRVPGCHRQAPGPGLLAPNRHVAVFPDAIFRLLEEEGLAMRLGRNARGPVRDNASREQAAGSVEPVFNE